MPTRAIHLISTTYGTWLPGDPSKPGHWSAMFDMYGRIVRQGGKLNMPDEATFDHARGQMCEPAKILDDEERRVVADIFRETITDASYSPALTRGLRIVAKDTRPPDKSNQNPRKRGAMCRVFAFAIEPTHFHLLTGPIQEDVGAFIGRLKGRSSSALLTHPQNWGRKRIWTRGYWRVFIFDGEPHVRAAQRYIEDHNQRAGHVSNPYQDWVAPIT